MSELAIKGGPKVRSELFPAYRPVGREEEQAAQRVIRSGVLSKFLGAWHDDFYGGPEVQALEKEWAEYFGVRHAISVNSATSGLYCAVGASGVGPGDEVIVSPYTMSASATAPLIFNAVPVFADIEEDYFCLDVDSIESRITGRTRAIIVVDIFGQPYDSERINKLAKKHNLLVIEDTAQAPAAKYGTRYAGTLGDIGVFSLNYHKHIHCGEGGVVVTNDDELAERVRLIRNHAEAVVAAKGTANLINMLGFNFRMTELEAAIAREQLKKLGQLVDKRRKNIEYLNRLLAEIPCLEPARVRPGCEHAYYVHPLKYRGEIAGVSRERFIEAVKAELMPTELRLTEGVKVSCGYVKPLYLMPLFQEMQGYGSMGCPFKCPRYEGNISYPQGLCPVTERMHFKELIFHELISPALAPKDLDDVVVAFNKVWTNRGEL
ncbi:MAG: DegT/DnrJ/EryC1/StrS family aminotransferase [Chitinophagales bacterium]